MDEWFRVAMRVTIIGGAGGMGRWFANFFRDSGADVLIVDKSVQTGKIAAEIGVKHLELDILRSNQNRNLEMEMVVDTDVLLLSVPIDITGRVIERVGPGMRQGSLMMDITSVKKKPVEMMTRFTPEGVEILGTHPLFGPSAKSMRGQTVIFVPQRVRMRSGSMYSRVYELFKRSGARIEILTAEEHDRVMSVLQGLTHFVLIASGITLKELEFDIERARAFMSPMYEILMDFVGRILHQDPRLYALIQQNLEMEEVHKTFLSVATRLYEQISASDIEGFIAEMRNARAHFGNTETERAMRDSDAVIEAKIEMEQKRSAGRSVP